MKKTLIRFDWLMVGSIFFLTILGLILSNFLVPKLFFQQLLYVFLGFFVFFLFSRIDFQILEKFSWVWYWGSIGFLFGPLIFGTITRGALRWIRIGSFNLQPSEIIKPFLLIFLSSLLATSDDNQSKKIWKSLFWMTIPLFLIFIQPDLGSSILIFLSWMGVLFSGVFRLTVVFQILGIIFGFLPIIWIFFLKEYQKNRIIGFFNPKSDPLGKGYNLLQSITAIGAGQFFGRGLGRGTQSHLQFLPEKHTDFIFASFAEDFGFLGVTILLFFFGLLLWRILRIAFMTKHQSSYFFCLGAFSMIFAQAFINIGMNLGLLPVVGIPLPLVSYGGSSFLSTMITLGIIENIWYNSFQE